MQNAKYFVQGQKVRLKVLHGENHQSGFEALTASVEECRKDQLILSLPYQVKEDEAFPFSEDMPLEVLTESLGMGLRVSAHVLERRGSNTIRLELKRDLQAFQNRLKQRTNSTVGLRLTKGQGTLKTLRERWRKNIEILHSGRDLSSLKSFTPCRVNLSSGGLRLNLNQSVAIADLFLLLIELKDSAPPICALAETVWISEDMTEKGLAVGMQFIAILEEDQSRIDTFVKKLEVSPDKKT